DDPATVREICARLDGLFLTGGVDVDPANYGEARHPKCGQTEPARDRIELMLIRWAMGDRKPILGVCRGVQALNVAAGGTLYQDIASQRPGAVKHDYFVPQEGLERHSLVHKVQMMPGSMLSCIVGLEELEVNSMHHQGIKDLAPGLRVC